MIDMRFQIVLPAIHLDDQPAFQTDKIDNIIAEPVLTSEIVAERLVAQAAPQAPLGIGQVATQISGSLISHGLSLRLTLPQGEGGPDVYFRL